MPNSRWYLRQLLAMRSHGLHAQHEHTAKGPVHSCWTWSWSSVSWSSQSSISPSKLWKPQTLNRWTVTLTLKPPKTPKPLGGLPVGPYTTRDNIWVQREVYPLAVPSPSPDFITTAEGSISRAALPSWHEGHQNEPRMAPLLPSHP